MTKRATWLTAEEQTTWRAFLLANQRVNEALDRELLQDADMPHAYYAILVALSEAEDRARRMNDLAAMLQYSPSRLTHAVSRMEDRGWLRREQCPTDRRGQIAVLTDQGHDALEQAAPGHVAEVRRIVFDRLTREQQTQLRDACESIVAGFATD